MYRFLLFLWKSFSLADFLYSMNYFTDNNQYGIEIEFLWSRILGKMLIVVILEHFFYWMKAVTVMLLFCTVGLGLVNCFSSFKANDPSPNTLLLSVCCRYVPPLVHSGGRLAEFLPERAELLRPGKSADQRGGQPGCQQLRDHYWSRVWMQTSWYSFLNCFYLLFSLNKGYEYRKKNRKFIKSLLIMVVCKNLLEERHEKFL